MVMKAIDLIWDGAPPLHMHGRVRGALTTVRMIHGTEEEATPKQPKQADSRTKVTAAANVRRRLAKVQEHILALEGLIGESRYGERHYEAKRAWSLRAETRNMIQASCPYGTSLDAHSFLNSLRQWHAAALKAERRMQNAPAGRDALPRLPYVTREMPKRRRGKLLIAYLVLECWLHARGTPPTPGNPEAQAAAAALWGAVTGAEDVPDDIESWRDWLGAAVSATTEGSAIPREVQWRAMMRGYIVG